MWDSADKAGSEDAMYDEWITVGSDYFDVGLGPEYDAFGADAFGAEFVERRRALIESRQALNQQLLANGYCELIRGGGPPLVSARRGEGPTYLIAEYATVPQDLLSAYEPLSEGRTALWIALDDSLKKAAGTLRGIDGDGSQVRIEFRHGFTSYGEKISIATPPYEPLRTHCRMKGLVP